MKNQKLCLVGRDSDDAAAGIIIVIVIAIIVISIVVAVVIYGGAFIGGFHSLKNYAISFKHNIVDSNLKAEAAA